MAISHQLTLAGRDGRPETRTLELVWSAAEGCWRTLEVPVAVRATARGRIHHRAFRWPPADPRAPERGPAEIWPFRNLLNWERAYPAQIPEIDPDRHYYVVAWADALAADGDPRHNDRPWQPAMPAARPVRDALTLALHGTHAELAAQIAAGGDPLGEAFDQLARQHRLREARDRLRDPLSARFAWGLTDPGHLATLASLGPLCEIGAGSGYWAALLRVRGVDLVAYEPIIPGVGRANGWHARARAWSELWAGGAEMAAAHPERTLLLVWPPYETSMASSALAAYTGRRLAYVGEAAGGCVADGRFWDLLESGAWHRVRRIESQRRWWGIQDGLEIWERPVPRPAMSSSFNGQIDLAAARELAARGHAGQVRTGTQVPYLVHPIGVAQLLARYYPGQDELIAAGYLHDLLEDTSVPPAEIERTFGPPVLALVQAVTRHPGWRVEALVADPAALRLKCADTLANVRDSLADLRAGVDVWARFSAGRRKLSAWQHTAAVARQVLGAEPLVRALEQTLVQVAKAETATP